MHTTATAMMSRCLVVTTTSTGAAYALGRIAIRNFVKVATHERGGHSLECIGEHSTDECGSPLSLDFISGPWLCWQLENRRLLTLVQEGQKHDLAIRKFQRIVMSGYFFFVDLPKDRRLMLDRTVVPRPHSS